MTFTDIEKTKRKKIGMTDHLQIAPFRYSFKWKRKWMKEKKRNETKRRHKMCRNFEAKTNRQNNKIEQTENGTSFCPWDYFFFVQYNLLRFSFWDFVSVCVSVTQQITAFVIFVWNPTNAISCIILCYFPFFFLAKRLMWIWPKERIWMKEINKKKLTCQKMNEIEQDFCFRGSDRYNFCIKFYFREK